VSKQDPYWFFKKWGFPEVLPMDDIYERLSNLEIKVKELEEKYAGALEDIKRLEEENVETTNVLYELGNSIDAVDVRIDILTGENWINKNV